MFAKVVKGNFDGSEQLIEKAVRGEIIKNNVYFFFSAQAKQLNFGVSNLGLS